MNTNNLRFTVRVTFGDTSTDEREHITYLGHRFDDAVVGLTEGREAVAGNPNGGLVTMTVFDIHQATMTTLVHDDSEVLV